MSDLKKLAEELKKKIKCSDVDLCDKAKNKVAKLQDKTISRTAFKVLSMKQYDEIVAEAMVKAIDRELGCDWDA